MSFQLMNLPFSSQRRPTPHLKANKYSLNHHDSQLDSNSVLFPLHPTLPRSPSETHLQRSQLLPQMTTCHASKGATMPMVLV